MSKRLSLVSGLAALGLWAATMVPANALIISRSTNFSYPCNGTNQVITFNFTGLLASSTLGIIGTSLALFANPGGVQFVTVSTNDGVFNVVLASLGQNDNHSQTIFSGQGINFAGTPESATIPIITNAGGAASFSLVGNCTGGPGVPPVQGTVIVWFLFNP
jgi:hypothetical protein